MKNFQLMLVTMLSLLFLVSCAAPEEAIIGESSGEARLAEISFTANVYTVLQSSPQEKDISEKIGMIDNLVNKLSRNNEAIVYDRSVDIKEGTGIYSLNNANDDQVVAIKIGGNFHSAIFKSRLNEKQAGE